MAIEYTAERYVDDVLARKQVACRWVILACERHRRDLETGYERGLFFDPRAGKVAIAFFHTFLKHSKGEWAGRPVLLEPWQQFHLWCLFGWKRADGSRRFRTCYLEVARKNGKSTLAAGIGLFLLVADGEPGAEVYSAATKRDQARIIHAEAVRMVKQSPYLRDELSLFRDNINHRNSFSKYEPVGRDSDSMDGLNVHGAMVDELHAHKNGDMWDVLETATSARRQPLMYAITTAGNDRTGICFQFHDYCKKILDGVIEDDAFFGTIYTLDREVSGESAGEGPVEDWADEANWVKANPNLGVSKKFDNLRDTARKAKHIPARLSSFLQKELNIWVQGGSRWILPERWAACDLYPIVRAELAGRTGYGGLDLSSTLDLTAWIVVFPPVDDGGVSDVLCRFWIPEENIVERVRRDRVPYDAWLRDGWIEATPGNVIDYDFILHAIREDSSDFQLAEIAFDPWNATSTSNALVDDGAEMIEFRQGYVSMNPAMKALEVAIMQRGINHGGHPVLAWMADNLVAAMDPAGNLKPDKSKSREKIDGIVALLMAKYRSTLKGGQTKSVYEDRGIRVL